MYMRILLINAPTSFVRELSSRDHDLLIAEREVAHLEAQLRNPRCQFLQLKGRKKIDITATRSLRRAILQFRPELIHAFLPSSLAQALIACIGLRVRPKIISFRGITRAPKKFDPSDWITYLSPNVSLHACESEAVKQAMMQGGIPERKCVVIYNCLPETKFISNRDELRYQFGIPVDAFVVGSAACMRPIKGFDILLKAAAELATLPNISFLLLGELKDAKAAQLAKDSRLSQCLKLAGYVDDAHRMMGVFDVFVMPSRREGLCRALLEAMDQSVCPVVSDAGGMKEMVRHGQDGLVFPTENSAALRDSLVRLFDNRDLIDRFGKSAQNRVHEICSPASFTNRLEDIYLQLCGQSQS